MNRRLKTLLNETWFLEMMENTDDKTITDLLLFIRHFGIVNSMSQWHTINVCWSILLMVDQYIPKNDMKLKRKSQFKTGSPSLVWANSRIVGNQSIAWFKTVFTGFNSLLVEVTSSGIRTPPCQLVFKKFYSKYLIWYDSYLNTQKFWKQASFKELFFPLSG